MTNGGIARAAQALAPRVAQSFSNRPFDKRLTTSRIHYSMFDVGRSMFISFLFDQTGSSWLEAALTPDTWKSNERPLLQHQTSIHSMSLRNYWSIGHVRGYSPIYL